MIGCWESEVHYCCLKSYGIFYCSNVWWDHIPDVNFTGVKGEHCSVDAAPGGDVMATVFDGFSRPGGGVMLIMLFKML